MLGTIAKKLRMLSFDTKYYAAIDDDSLILIAKKEERVIITKDHLLVTNATQHDIITIEILTHTEKEQLVEIAQKMCLRKFDLSNPRCSVCNGMLQEVVKQQIIDNIPSRVAGSVQRFCQCEQCSHTYWVGTHIRNLEKLIAEVNDAL
ncbi:MAG: Mut7-C RNAse domain-containing protein [Candidatus Nitrosotenuis sp.]